MLSECFIRYEINALYFKGTIFKRWVKIGNKSKNIHVATTYFTTRRRANCVVLYESYHVEKTFSGETLGYPYSFPTMKTTPKTKPFRKKSRLSMSSAPIAKLMLCHFKNVFLDCFLLLQPFFK